MPDAHWLSDDEQRAWLALITVMTRVPAMLDSQLQRDAGVTHFDYAILVRLSQCPGCCTQMSALADMTNGSLSRLSHAVKKLEERGWVQRSPNPDDGRLTDATLTKAGKAKLARTAPGHVAEARRLVIDAISPKQLRQLRDVVEKIAVGLDQAPE